MGSESVSDLLSVFSFRLRRPHLFELVTDIGNYKFIVGDSVDC